jgi:hypothetical protein
VIGSPGGPQGHGQHNPGFHGVPPRTAGLGGFESTLGVRHGGGALTCGELDLGPDPASAYLGPPPGVFGRCTLGEPPRGPEAPEGEVVGGQAEEGIGSGTSCIEAVGVWVALEAGRLREGLAVEGAGLAVAAQLPPVGGEGAGGEGGEDGVSFPPEDVQESRGGGVAPLGAEHDRGQQPRPGGTGTARDDGIGQRKAPEGGGAEGGFVHPSFVAVSTDKIRILAEVGLTEGRARPALPWGASPLQRIGEVRRNRRDHSLGAGVVHITRGLWTTPGGCGSAAPTDRTLAATGPHGGRVGARPAPSLRHFPLIPGWTGPRRRGVLNDSFTSSGDMNESFKTFVLRPTARAGGATPRPE